MTNRKVNSATASPACSNHESAGGPVLNEPQRIGRNGWQDGVSEADAGTADRADATDADATETEQVSCIDIAVVLVQCDGHFLVGVRSEADALAGKAEFPGGKVEADEQVTDAARRECLEETGLDVNVTTLHSVHVQQYDHARVRLHFFNASLPGVNHPSPLPPAPWRWVARRDLASLDFPSGNRFVIQELTRAQEPTRAQGPGLHE